MRIYYVPIHNSSILIKRSLTRALSLLRPNATIYVYQKSWDVRTHFGHISSCTLAINSAVILCLITFTDSPQAILGLHPGDI